MRKEKLKVKAVPLFIIMMMIPLIAIIILTKVSLKESPSIEINEKYIPDEIVDNTIPVVNPTKNIIYPYLDANVKTGKNYYDYKGTEENQINSIIEHDNTYIQNTGIDYVADNTFDVVAILEGTVVNVKDDETVGKTIEIKHDNGYVSIYQSLSEILVKKDDIVTQGQIIGKSGTNELDKDLGNHLHFEMYVNGQNRNPEDYLNKEIKKEN